MTGKLDGKRLRIVLYEGRDSQPLDDDRRLETLVALLEDGHCVTQSADTGAVDCVIRDLRDEFVENYVFPAISGNAIYEGTYLLGTSLARPVLAKEQVAVAHEFGAEAVAHGCTGKGNDQMRFELSFQALDRDLKIIAPWRNWDLGGRTELMAYAEKFAIPIETTQKKPYSIDRNLFHVSYEGGILEDPWTEPLDDMFEWTTSPMDAPEVPQTLQIDFERGLPVAVDGESLRAVPLLERLNEVAAAHGVGRVDMVDQKARADGSGTGSRVLHDQRTQRWQANLHRPFRDR